MTLKQLYEGCKNNDPVAWRHALNFAMDYLNRKYTSVDQSTREVIAQEVLKYFIIGGILITNDPKTFKRFLIFKIEKQFKSYWRQKKRREENFFPIELESKQDSGLYENPDIIREEKQIEKEFLYMEMLGLILRSCECLNGRLREVTPLYIKGKIRGESINEMAEKAGITPNNFTVAARRGIKQLKKLPEVRDILA